ncbi:nitronate monooxygenase [Pedobacter aquatilis]|uniref:NAD(P)H-dependent flavin oxidoreductase n=1 Tax=Pedobacter aquatilis TaxID=351343 RepID=UPI002930B052|nr:nitronate monooxygenase [Pedobacter aquatilis]
MRWKSRLTSLIDIEYPIIQAPMFGVTSPEMVAAAHKANCLGSLALADLNASQCVEAIRATKKLTNRNFAANIFTHKIPPLTENLKQQYIKAKAFIEQLASQYQLDVTVPDLADIKLNSYHEQIEAIIEEDCKILSFTFGNIDQASIDSLKNKGILLIGTCTSVQEAVTLEQSGIDVICVQGLEAGGHRGSFSSEDIPHIGGLSLLAQVKDSTSSPIVYAGGIYDAKTLLAAKTLGADGFQIGSLLLASTESMLKDFEKERLRKVKESEIMLTKSFSGRYARGIKNTFIEATENSDNILPYPYQNKLTAGLRSVARSHKNADFVNLWLGQSINGYNSASTTEIIKKLIADTENYHH